MNLINPITQEPFGPHPISPEGRRRAEQNLADAQANFDRNPDLDHTIWLGRRLAYLHQFEDAFEVYGEGIERFPDAHQLYRHRGHRYITTRQFERAIADFEHAAELARSRPVEVEPDGLPNRLNRPTSNTHFNIWYHLGLAYYLTRQFAQAAEAYAVCMTYSDNHDSICATADWHYMTLRRLGKDTEAGRLLELITPDMDLIESESYHRRLLMYQGVNGAESLLNPAEESRDALLLTLATQGYGVATWYLYNDRPERAKEIYRRVIETGFWSAFGYIAAEQELKE